MIDYLIDIDTSFFLWLNANHSPFWDVFMKMTSAKFTWTGMYAAIIYEIWRIFGWRTLIVTFLATIVAITMSDQITASILRPIFERLRPANPENPISQFVHIVDGYRGGRYGFPSCHAANSFALASFMGLLFQYRRFTWFIICWAVLNSYSRIYLGVHYPGDLLVGMVIGGACGCLMYVISRYVCHTWIGTERRDERVRRANISGFRFSYHPADVPIFVGILTCGYILVFASSIFFPL